jgi:hypothetical protein
MGYAFINHHHRLARTHAECRGLPKHEDNSSMLAEAHAFQASLRDAMNAQSKSLHIIADCKTLIRIALGRDVTNGIERNSAAFTSVMNDIIHMIKQFNSVVISHVRSHLHHSHPGHFVENSVVDLLAGLASSDAPFSLCDTVTTINHNAIMRSILSIRKPRGCDRVTSIPFISESTPRCSTCKCPSHNELTCCFTNATDTFPLLSIYCKIQPDRPATFVDQIAHPELIDWDRVPASMGGDIFVRFTSICYNNLRHPDRHRAALHALHMFSKTYCIIHGHISKRKAIKQRVDPSSTPDATKARDEQLARDAKTAARLAREFHYHDATKVLNRQLPIGPDHPAAKQQLPLLYPKQVEEANIPAAPPVPGRTRFDRHVIWNYIKGRSSTSSPGVSGYGFIWLQHFGRLTIANETPKSPDPHWTVLVALIEDLACGSLPWLRTWATSLKGALFAKTPDPLNIKLRNLGIAETLVRVAAYMVTLEAVSCAQQLGLISTFDLGVGVPGGTEKFVRIAQLAAESGLTILSADLEKAFNNMKRSDIWRAVQHLNCPILTSWFCFFFHLPPVVHFTKDPTAPFELNGSHKCVLWEGVAQGDPCSSFLFVVTLSFILAGFKRRHPNALLITVIDDTCITLPADHSHTLPSVAADFINTLQLHNLHVNSSKTIVYCSGAFNFNTNDLPYALSHEGFSVCRVAVGAPHFVAAHTQAIIDDIQTAETLFSRLHAALYNCRTQGRCLIFMDVLRLCFLSRWQWHMRTLTPSAACRIALAADSALLRLLQLILPHRPSSPLHPLWHHLHTMHNVKIALPLKKGGLGMRPWHSLLDICHFSSWAEAGPRILLFMQHMSTSIPHQISTDIGHSVASLQTNLMNPPDFWLVGTETKRFKLQHHLTEQLDTFDYLRCSKLSHDPAVNAQFMGSCLPHMCLPFNASAIPRSDLESSDQALFPYAIAFHSMMPLFPTDMCLCGELVDPLGLHFGSCLKLNARNLLHNALRDCFCGAARNLVRDHPDHNIAFIKSDAIAKSTTYIHPWYPRKTNAPPIRERQRLSLPQLRSAPSKSPDVLISFLDDPHRPVFGDFVFSSPSSKDKTSHSEAAQIAHNTKVADYSKQHDYPSNVFFPLAAERSGYIHPVFTDFIDMIVARAMNAPPIASHKLQLLYAIAYSITYMTAALLRSASFQFVPAHVRSLMPPPPLAVPVRWAPQIIFHKRHTPTFGSLSSSNGSRRRHAEITFEQPASSNSMMHAPSSSSEVPMLPCDHSPDTLAN